MGRKNHRMLPLQNVIPKLPKQYGDNWKTGNNFYKQLNNRNRTPQERAAQNVYFTLSGKSCIGPQYLISA